MALSKTEQLRLFFKTNEVPCKWIDLDASRNVMAWINVQHLKSFCDIIGSEIHDNHDLHCVLCDGELALPMRQVLQPLGIKLETIFGKDPQS